MPAWPSPGGAREGDGGAAYLPWVEVLRALGVDAAGVLDPAAGRARQFDAVVAALRAAAGPLGLLIVLDDLHWADLGSLRLLHAVAAEIATAPILILALFRPGRPDLRAEPDDHAAVLGAIARERTATRIDLAPLSPGAVADLVMRAAGHPVDDAVLDRIVERSGGNPLFVTELARLPAAAAPDTVPATVRDVIRRRLDGCDPAARAALRAASVLGAEFPVSLVDAPEAVWDAVSAAGLIEPDGSRARFTHALIQEVLYTELPAAERRRLHAAAAARLTDPADLDLRAHHLRAAVPLGDAAGAVAVTRATAARARRQLAHEHAASLIRSALALVTADGERAALLLDLADCEARAGAVERSWAASRAAIDLGRATGDPAVLADAATVLRGLVRSPLTPQVHAAAREALTYLPASDTVRTARLLGQLAATAERYVPDAEPDLGSRAMAAAEACGDPQALALALQGRIQELNNARYVRQRLDLGTRAVGAGHECGDDDITCWGYTWRLNAYAQLGDRSAFDAELLTFTGAVERLREPRWRWRLASTRAAVALYEGRFAQAQAAAAEALSIGQRGDDREAEYFDLVFRGELGRATGEGLDEVETDVRRVVAEAPAFVHAWLALILVGCGRLDEAAAIWAAVAPHLEAFPRDANEWISGAAGCVELCLALDDLESAKVLYTQLEPLADRYVVPVAHAPNKGPVALYLGMLAAATGDWPNASTHLHNALTGARVTGSAMYEAVTHLWLARMHQGRRGAGDGQAARASAEQARRIAERIGMAPLAASAAALTDGSGLTPREEEVAALVADGRSNRQIATRLGMSERTAENHVTHILTKLGFDSRARIASWWAGRTG